MRTKDYILIAEVVDPYFGVFSVTDWGTLPENQRHIFNSDTLMIFEFRNDDLKVGDVVKLAYNSYEGFVDYVKR